MSEDQPPIVTIPVPPTSDAPLDGNSALGAGVSKLIALAAKGDLIAQRYLRDSCVDEVRHPRADLPNHDLLALYAIFAARMAASHGEHEDLQRLATTLLMGGVYFGTHDREGVAMAFAAESLSLFERMGERGDTFASNTADQLVAEHPGLVAGAKFYMAKDADQ